ncbi:hypothetical protein B0H63DRAFT_308024 [Podospora didyma]|uniref:Uncharacterized protein n=1 Tax=Podospora didyma TaxID=330526 RepID=A0AAE0N462_9PEZI|nr:hypothetical protein B0H63DRAFT_308024 [Podospora didyma]
MSAREPPPKIASVEDADESGNPIEGTGRYAASTYAASTYAPSTYAPSTYAPSPTKEKPNTGRQRRERSRRETSSPIPSALTDSDSTVHPRRDSLKKSPRDRDRHDSNTIMPSHHRPPVKQSKTTSSLPRKDMEASYYGVNPTVTPASSRPRAQTSNPRPASYYGGASRPPLANARWYQNQTPAPLPTSFPPPSWAGGGAVPYPSPSPSPVVMQQPPLQDYFSSARPLEARFSTGPRPQSAIGFRGGAPRAIGYDDYEEEPPVQKSVVRRPSSHRKSSRAEDDRKMPPPPPRRTASARPTTLAFRPPPPSTPAPMRRSGPFDDDDLVAGDNELFRDVSPLAPYDYGAPVLRTRRRPSVGAASIAYELGEFRTEVAGRNSRRNSYYGGQSTSSGSAYEDKLRQASIYQDDVTGGPAMPLTAETLRKAGRNGGSSSATRSSDSRDESEYRQSATTRTTRSSANDEDVTIRVKGNTVLKVGGAEMQCRDGAEINIISRGATPFRSNSDQSSYIDQDDRRTRYERPPPPLTARTRASSQARSSYTRPLPPMPQLRYDASSVYDHQYTAPMQYAPPYPYPREDF